MDKIISPSKKHTSEIGLVLATTILFITLAIFQILISQRTDLPQLFGERSNAVFDLWSLQHFCSGILLGSLITYVASGRRLSWQNFLLATLLIALAWEAIELAMEAGVFGAVIATWKGSFEHWGNRLIGDPLMVATGSLVARRFRSAWKWILLPAAIWFTLNALSPNSMSVQRFLLGR